MYHILLELIVAIKQFCVPVNSFTIFRIIEVFVY